VARKKIQSGPLQLNLTSMMDVVFQLIIFFLLVNNMSSAELPKLEPPEPTQSKAYMLPDRKSVTINVIPQQEGATVAKSVRVGVRDILPGNYGELTELLKVEVAKNPHIEVDLRSDRSIHYTYVQPVMNAITAAGIGKINLVAHIEKNKPGGQ